MSVADVCGRAVQEYLGACRNVTRQYRRSLFGVAAVAFGVVALMLATGFVEWIFWASREGTIQNGLGHVHVMRDGYLKEGQADPFSYLVDEASPAVQQIAAMPGLKAMAPRLAFNAMISCKPPKPAESSTSTQSKAIKTFILIPL